MKERNKERRKEGRKEGKKEKKERKEYSANTRGLQKTCLFAKGIQSE